MFRYVSIFLLCIATRFMNSASGDLDSSFGSSGIVITSAGRFDFITTVTVQFDDKIVVGGVVGTMSSKLAVARYDTNGTLDTTFNTTGVQTLLIGSRTEGTGLALQTDGKIVTGGFAYQSQTNNALVRYTTNGTLDNSFSGSGYVTTSLGRGATIHDIIIQPDTNIVVAGTTVTGMPQFFLARYDNTGALDTTFGNAGTVLTPMGLACGIHAIALQNDGKIVAGGYVVDGSVIAFALARFNTDGSLDTGFGSSGVVTTAIGIEAKIQAIKIQPDGKIVVAGYTYEAPVSKFVVARYDSTGALDGSFNTTGIVMTEIEYSSRAYALGIQSSGKIIAGGYAVGDAFNEFALARYTTAGALDNTFGTGGMVVTTVGNDDASINSIVIQSDDKIVAAGFTGKDFALARYLA